MSDNHLQLAQRLYDLFGQGDIPGVLGLLDEHIEWREAEGNPYDHPARRGAVRRRF